MTDKLIIDADVKRIQELEAERDKFCDALNEIVQWSKAYPVEVFPEPDLEKANKLLAVGGMSTDCIAAKAMRHVVEGVGKIALSALRAGGGEGNSPALADGTAEGAKK